MGRRSLENKSRTCVIFTRGTLFENHSVERMDFFSKGELKHVWAFSSKLLVGILFSILKASDGDLPFQAEKRTYSKEILCVIGVPSESPDMNDKIPLKPSRFERSGKMTWRVLLSPDWAKASTGSNMNDSNFGPSWGSYRRLLWNRDLTC